MSQSKFEATYIVAERKLTIQKGISESYFTLVNDDEWLTMETADGEEWDIHIEILSDKINFAMFKVVNDQRQTEPVPVSLFIIYPFKGGPNNETNSKM